MSNYVCNVCTSRRGGHWDGRRERRNCFRPVGRGGIENDNADAMPVRIAELGDSSRPDQTEPNQTRPDQDLILLTGHCCC